MAPFVEMEWGRKATSLMWDLKELFDPDYVLNPGVVLNHVRPPIHHPLRTVHVMSSIPSIAHECVELAWHKPNGLEQHLAEQASCLDNSDHSKLKLILNTLTKLHKAFFNQ